MIVGPAGNVRVVYKTTTQNRDYSSYSLTGMGVYRSNNNSVSCK